MLHQALVHEENLPTDRSDALAIQNHWTGEAITKDGDRTESYGVVVGNMANRAYTRSSLAKLEAIYYDPIAMQNNMHVWSVAETLAYLAWLQQTKDHARYWQYKLSVSEEWFTDGSQPSPPVEGQTKGATGS